MSMPSLTTDRGSKPGTRHAPSVLDNIGVAFPCPATWEKMTGDDRVRHCQECKLNVYNLSEMTRIEAARLIADREGRLCVRFYRRPDGTILTRDCPRGLQIVIRRVSRLAGAALSAMMSLGTAFAQTSPQPCPQSGSDQAVQKAAQLELTVVDPLGAVIPGAIVKLAGKDGKEQFSGVTRGDGVAWVSGLPGGRVVLTVEHRGFKTYRKKLVVKKDQPETLRITLKIDKGETVVVGELTTTAPLIDRDSTTIQTTFSSDLIQRLPLR